MPEQALLFSKSQVGMRSIKTKQNETKNTNTTPLINFF